MSGEETEEMIADCRAGRFLARDRVRCMLAELLADAEASGAYPLPREEREWVDAPSVGREWPNSED